MMTYYKDEKGQLYAGPSSKMVENLSLIEISEAEFKLAVEQLEKKTVDERRRQAKDAVDLAAGEARARFVSGGQLIDQEYAQVEKAVEAWRAAGSPADAAPVDVRSWAEAENFTVEEAAQAIEQTAAAWREVLSAIRQIRLAGKAAVDAAKDLDAPDDMSAVAGPYIEKLNAFNP